MNGGLAEAFSLVCGQNPDHTWIVGGLALPCCERCTGLYAGAACALILHLVFRPQSRDWHWWVHALLLLQMAPFGLHWVEQGAVLRTVSGLLFGFGLVAYLWIAPTSLIKRPFPPCPRGCGPGYGLGLVCTVLLVPGLALWGGVLTASVLTCLAVAGALTFATLVVLNIGLGLVGPSRWIRVSTARVNP
ncbi:MAG: DUF2085 domain-containing protein [Verrucomicrobiae bacterium]|nr:DUF2085 domain-containing protein [Verrucomicrobiae bacterium]MCP5520587.1 DUF2085 domain-containing protein [Verrucomicrobiales bacterium]